LHGLKTYHFVEMDSFLPQMELQLGKGTGSDETIVLAQKWIDGCVQDHKLCRRSADDLDFRPTRLLQIFKASDRITIWDDSAKVGTPVKYATLSHRWGSATDQQLTTINHSQYTGSEGLDLRCLSKTYREAIEVCLKLDIKYLWIDSLCIIQDSDEDWMQESTQMHLIYGNAFCNIAATSAADSEDGLFRARNASSQRPVKLHFATKNDAGEEDSIDLYLTDAGLWWNRWEREPLNRRAWVLQVISVIVLMVAASDADLHLKRSVF
jgi:hypothetical protein